jgi:hypothetical protein
MTAIERLEGAMRGLLIFPAAVLLLAACGSNSGGSGGGADPAGSASAARTGAPLASSTGQPSATPTGCAQPGDTINARRGEQPAPICLAPGAAVRIVTDPSPRQPWGVMGSSDESVVRCDSRAAADGALVATCTAVSPGTATVSTVTAPFAGDPHGPPQDIWRLRVTVSG